MLRSSLRSARVLGGKPVIASAGRQWPIATSRQAFLLNKRHYASNVPKTPVIPPSETNSSERTSTIDDVGETKAAQIGEVPLTPPTPNSVKGRPEAFPTEDDVGESSVNATKIHPLAGGKPKPPATEDDFGESSVHATKIHPLAGGKPKPPATEDDIGESSVNATKIHPLAGGRPKPTATIDDMGESSVNAAELPPLPPKSPPPPPPPKKKGFFRRLRNFVFTLMVLGAVGFGGGVWYSRINDTFHDFFTEYVPFAEQAVLYLEERDFKKRFPNAANRTVKSRDGDQQIRIPAQSGASWRVADSGEPVGRQSSSNPAAKKAPSPATSSEPAKAQAPMPPAQEAAPSLKTVERTTPSDTPKPAAPVAEKAAPTAFRAPEVNEPSKFPPLKTIDLMALPDARDPLVQDLVHMLNDLILVVNADGAHVKYGSTITKAKNDILKVGGKLRNMKLAVEKKAAQEVKSNIAEFDKAANDLVNRVEKAMIAQESDWRQEFETEMKQVRETYDERAKLLLERETKVNAEKLQNQLLQQAIALKKEFVEEVQGHVEQERDSRLGKLNDLTTAVKDLEDLTVGWNNVVDTNLKTQQLHVAIKAVTAKLDTATHPQPFIKELVALKEIASDDPLVNAAISSVNPTAYQRGISPPAQLIDRFRRVAGEVRKASLLPEDAGVASHASSWMLSHVMFKKQGLAEGNDVESILTRTQTFLEEGDLDGAAREMNGLDGWAKTLSKDWLSEVRKVLEVRQALEVIATEARLQSLRVD